jgi:hypothetical protein
VLRNPGTGRTEVLGNFTGAQFVPPADQGKDRDSTRDDFAHDQFRSSRFAKTIPSYAFVSVNLNYVNTCQHLNYVKTLSLNLSFV